MQTVKVMNWKKEQVREFSLPDEVFSVEVKPHILHQVVCWQQAGRRQGNHQAKTRGQVSGGGKKPFRQKGTGNARQGSIRSPLNRGGGVTFGPKKRSYAYSLPKKIRAEALKQSLAYLWKENKISVCDQMPDTQGKTKVLYQHLKVFGLKKSLLSDHDPDLSLQRACRNLQGFSLLPPTGLNVLDLLKHDYLVISVRGLESLLNRILKKEVAG